MSIASATSECLERLDILGELEQYTHEWAQNQKARLKLWASTLGVFADGRLSLAHRLRLTHDASKILLQLLEGLLANIKVLESIQNDCRSAGSCTPASSLEHEPSEPDPTASGSSNLQNATDPDDGVSDTSCSSLTVEALQAEVEDAISQLIAYSALLRKQGSHQHERSANFVPEDSNGSMIDDYKKFAESECFQLLPDENEYQPAPFLIERLHKTIFQRWQMMCYRNHHADRLAVANPENKTMGLSAGIPRGTEPTRAIAPEPKVSKGVSPVRSARVGTTNGVQSSSATSVPPEFQLPEPISKKVGVPSSLQTRIMPCESTDYPRTPKLIAGASEAKCPLCHLPQRVETFGARWEQHVLHDLCPYICVFDKCQSPEKLYMTSSAWEQHMQLAHVDRTWPCKICQHGLHEPTDVQFEDVNGLAQHLKIRHSEQFADSADEIDLVARLSVSEKPTSLSGCPICGWQRELAFEEGTANHQHLICTHIAQKHLHPLALISLPWCQAETNSTTSDGSNSASAKSKLEDYQKELLQEPDPEYGEGAFSSGSRSTHLAQIQRAAMVIPREDTFTRWLHGLPVQFEPIADGATETRPGSDQSSLFNHKPRAPASCPSPTSSLSMAKNYFITASDSFERASDVLRDLLESKIRSPEGDKPHSEFCPPGAARMIFHMQRPIVNTLYVCANAERRDSGQANADAQRFSDAVCGDYPQKAKSNILAILLSCRRSGFIEAWQKFEQLCLGQDANGVLCDSDLPLNKQRIIGTFGSGIANDFNNVQFIYCPIVFRSYQLVSYLGHSESCRLPFIARKKIGAGAHGKVYAVKIAAGHFQGLDSSEDAEYAQKQFNFDSESRDQQREEWDVAKWLIEATSGTRHRNISFVLAALEHGPSLSLIYERADCDLWKYMQGAGKHPNTFRDPFSEMKRILSQVIGIAEGLRFLHNDLRHPDKGPMVCFHLDLKPQNILVYTARGEPESREFREVFKITDFSISAIVWKAPALDIASEPSKERSVSLNKLFSSRPSASGIHSSTPIQKLSVPNLLGEHCDCIAPEAMTERQGVSASADVWAFGCVLTMVLAWLLGESDEVLQLQEERGKVGYRSWFFHKQSGLKENATHKFDLIEETQAATMTSRNVFMLNTGVERWYVKACSQEKNKHLAELCESVWQLLYPRDEGVPSSGILIPNPKYRLTMDEVCENLRRIHQKWLRESHAHRPKPSLPQPGNEGKRPRANRFRAALDSLIGKNSR